MKNIIRRLAMLIIFSILGFMVYFIWPIIKISQKYKFENNSFTVIPLDNFESIGKLNDSLPVYRRVYLVQGFSKDSITHERYIDSFVCTLTIDKYFYFNSISFYKESKYTNIDHLTKVPRDLVRISQDQDMLFGYYWTKGEFERKMDFTKSFKSDDFTIHNKDICK